MLRYIFLFIFLFNINIVSAKPYNRVVSLTLSSDEMLLSLVPKERIQGLSGKINSQKDISFIADKTSGFPVVEGNIEVLMDMNPDLVVAADWMKKDVILQLKSLGVDLFVYKTPNNFAEQKDLILEYSKLLDVEARGKEIVEDMDRRLKILQEKIAKKNLPKPEILLYTPFESTSGANTTFDDMVRLINGRNIAKESGIKNSEKLSKEKIIDLNPEIIIVPIWRDYIDSDDFIKFIKNDKSFENIKAVKNNKVYVILYRDTTTTSQYMIDGIEKLAGVVYGLD